MRVGDDSRVDASTKFRCAIAGDLIQSMVDSRFEKAAASRPTIGGDILARQGGGDLSRDHRIQKSAQLRIGDRFLNETLAPRETKIGQG